MTRNGQRLVLSGALVLASWFGRSWVTGASVSSTRWLLWRGADGGTRRKSIVPLFFPAFLDRSFFVSLPFVVGACVGAENR